MASISGLSSPFKLDKLISKPSPNSPLQFPQLRKEWAPFPISRSHDQNPVLSVARDTPVSLDGLPKWKKGLEKDPQALWERYVDWLYQHKELGLYLDVNWIGFTDEFVEELEPKFQAAFKAMEALEKGAIANPDR